MTQKQEKLIESYIRSEVKKQLSESKIIIQADGQKDPLVVGGVGNQLYISQRTENKISAVSFTLKQMRKICEFFENYDPQATTVRSVPRPRINQK
jgi:hypothetical protein